MQLGEEISTRRPPHGTFAAMIVIAGMDLLAVMDGNVSFLALPRIQYDLGLSDANRSWVVISYLLTFAGLMLLGGRIGDAIGRKRAFICGVVVFTIASALCGLAWDGGSLIGARLLQGAAGAVIAPNCWALVATTFPKGPSRNYATAVLGAVTAIGGIVGMVAAGALTDLSWRLAFLINVPAGLFVVYLARTALRETQTEPVKLDVAGAALATIGCSLAVFSVLMGSELGWSSAAAVAPAVVAAVTMPIFVMVERRAANPVLPLALFHDRDRLATFAGLFLAGGLTGSLALIFTLYAQEVLGYSARTTATSFIPFAIATAAGMIVTPRLVTRYPPRTIVIAGCVLLLSGLIYASTFTRGGAYVPGLLLPLVIGGIGLAMINIPLTLALIASVDSQYIGPTSAVAMMLQNFGEPVLIAIVQVAVTLRTIASGGVNGSALSMNGSQLDALNHGYTYGMLWLAGAAVLIVVVALGIRYTARQVAYAQEAKNDMEGRSSLA